MGTKEKAAGQTKRGLERRLRRGPDARLGEEAVPHGSLHVRGRGAMHKVNEQDVEAVEMADGVTVQTLIGPNEEAPNFAMRLFKVAPLAKTPLHTHAWEHEVFVLQGEGIVVCEGKEHSFGRGDAILVPPEVEHRFRNIGGGELQFICVIPNEGSR